MGRFLTLTERSVERPLPAILVDVDVVVPFQLLLTRAPSPALVERWVSNDRIGHVGRGQPAGMKRRRRPRCYHCLRRCAIDEYAIDDVVTTAHLYFTF